MINDAQHLTRQIMGNVPPWLGVVFYVSTIAAIVWAGLALAIRFRQHRQGRSASFRPSRPWGPRVAAVLRYLAFHRQLLRDRYAGLAHLLLFYGFLILLVGTCLVFLEHDTPLHFFYGRFYLVASLVIDLGGIAFVIGLLMFLHRRLFGNSLRILQRAYVAALLWLLLGIAVTGFTLEGARIAVDRPNFERWSVAGYALATVMNFTGISGDVALRWHRITWGLHAVLCVAFFALLPWRFFSHMVFGPVSWALRADGPRAALRPVELQLQPGATHRPGATSWRELPWIDLLQADACTTCGRCNAVCPADAVGKPLHPREIVLGVRHAMSQPEATDFSALFGDDAVWSCTTCGACNEACPVGIEVYDKIIELRRGRVEAGRVPAAAADRFENSATEFNPFQEPNAGRMDWAAGLNVPVAEPGERIKLLYWVGCAGSFDPDGRSVSRAMVKILNHLGVAYHVLGPRECCTGDPLRRMGEEGLFQELAQANIQLFDSHGVLRVLTHCPHCFNTFANEYPQLGEISFEVEHHSQFLARMIAENKLQLTGGIADMVTFHDPCYLARGNGEIAAPRQILKSLPQIAQVEMPRHGGDSFCCGAGGGSIWLDVKGNDRIENQRAAEAAGTGATTVVTACPFCKVMLEAGRQSLDGALDGALDGKPVGAGLKVRDLAELIVQSEGL